MVLQRFCHVDNVEGLAPIWGRLARGAKSELQSILQQEFSRVCTGRGLSTDYYCPAVTSSIKQLVTGLNFAGHGQDDISGGCQPFLVVYSGAEDHYRSMDNAILANQLDQSGDGQRLPRGHTRNPREGEGEDAEGSRELYTPPVCSVSPYALPRSGGNKPLFGMPLGSGQSI